MTDKYDRNTLIIIGWGNQAKTWANNLRDSSYPVKIFLRKNSPSIADVEDGGFEIIDEKDFPHYKFFALLIPDDQHRHFFKNYHRLISKNSHLIYAHGYAPVTDCLPEHYPDFQHVLLAPKSIASEMRQDFIEQKAIYAVFSTEYCSEEVLDLDQLEIIGKALGVSRFVKASMADEMKCDLFSEQAVLCGGVPHIIEQAYSLLIDKGISKELAYLEIWHEFFLIAKTLEKVGPQNFFQMISPNALHGTHFYEQNLNKSQLKQLHNKLWESIENKTFENYISTSDNQTAKQKMHSKWSKSQLQKVFNDFHNLSQ